MGIVRRDLKPENILCGSRIGGGGFFFLSRLIEPLIMMSFGSLTHMAPEVSAPNGYGKEADILSVGTVVYLPL
ncbi:unnamed protein product [Sphacelaria rigidula]